MNLEYFINLARPKTTADVINQYFYLHLNRAHEGNRYHGGLYLNQKLMQSSERIILFSFDTTAQNYFQALSQINQWGKEQKVPLFYQNMLNIPENAFQLIRPLKQPVPQQVKHFNTQYVRE